ncbi:hypothetical protein NDU88_000344 [Pleurodeles waltl]|uniref:Uncharacterized protein n=1 Tax=Pleurodeles waltl TaxID=8319 RepID=A0AAV7N7P9_PLEWA|nr:hypothetical protein NDU88_000344 [Pleurodeles waltl]
MGALSEVAGATTAEAGVRSEEPSADDGSRGRLCIGPDLTLRLSLWEPRGPEDKSAGFSAPWAAVRGPYYVLTVRRDLGAWDEGAVKLQVALTDAAPAAIVCVDDLP